MKLKKDEGAILNTVTTIGSILLAVLVIFYMQTLQKMYMASDTIENDLVASTLAAAIADTDLYGSTLKIKINDPNEAYDTFKDSLKENFQLDNSFFSINSDSIIKSQVKIENFTIYNVDGNDISEIKRDNAGTVITTDHIGKKGILTTPRGEIINNTTIYTKIVFNVGDFWGVSLDNGFKDCTVDITDK